MGTEGNPRSKKNNLYVAPNNLLYLGAFVYA